LTNDKNICARNRVISDLYRALHAVLSVARSDKRVLDDAATLHSLGIMASINLDAARAAIEKFDPPPPLLPHY
jgi:hypothetical protein